jgi:DNA-directed RNA polymerase subunit H
MAAHVSESVLLIRNVINYLFPYRGIKMQEGQDIKAENIILKMLNNHYFNIIGVKDTPRGNRSLVYVYLLDNDPTKVNINLPVKNKPDFAKLMENILKDPKLNMVDEIIILAPDIFFSKKAIMLYFKELIAKEATEVYDEAGNKPYFTASRSDLFSFNWPAHESTFKHEIMSKEEVASMMARERITMDSLPILNVDDPACAWIGGRIGQVVRITRLSEITGISIIYRRIK